ncbi:MAG: permease [candidate division Zixibacteria bacterium]|nr:permease [candidate division Zixibacteria bacterium]
MNWKKEWKPLTAIVVVFLIFYFIPKDLDRIQSALFEAVYLTQWYAREHVLLCLVPAFFIAGAIGVFIGQASVMKYLGPRAKKYIAYPVASVAGSILAVCSCTILPLFAGIYRMGAGLGPAVAFLYSGPAINIMAIILTARILGFELGVARAVGAVIFSIVIGLIMQFIYRREESAKAAEAVIPDEDSSRNLLQTAIYFAVMIGILIFATWSKPEEVTGLWASIYANKWIVVSFLGGVLGLILINWFKIVWWKILFIAIPPVILWGFFPEAPALSFTSAVIGLSVITGTAKDETGEWFAQSWDFAKKIMPLLFYGVLVAGLLLGRPGHQGLIPNEWIAAAVGGNSIAANLFASVAGAFMYFATLTEVPILQGLIGSGMGKGPALALLLAGPALSLPNMLVIKSVMGLKKTVVYVFLVVIMSTISGIVYGLMF